MWNNIKNFFQWISNIRLKIKQYLQDNLFFIFIILVLILFVCGITYFIVLNPTTENIIETITKYKIDDYSIPYFIAERCLIWNRMRGFFFALHYILTLLSIFASLLTIFYASNTSKLKKSKHNKKIVFLSLLSMCFTISEIFINPGSMANMAQHAWRETDLCIMQTVNDSSLSTEEKNSIIINKVAEMERYVETYEH